MYRFILPFVLVLSNVMFAQNSNKITFEPVSFSNPNFEDFSPSPYKEGILFVSNRDTKSDYYRLFYSDFKNLPIPIEIKGEKRHIGQTFYDAANDMVYVTKSAEKNANFYINLAIYKGNLNNYKIDNLEKLSFCKPNFSYGHPQIKNNKLLIHTSEFGGNALVLYALENSVWKNPKVIYKDKFPIINPVFKDENTIYFASKRTTGLGGYDLYKIVKIEDHWTEEPVNLKEFNSSQDDLSIIFINEMQGYISSNWQNKFSQIFKFTIE